MERFIFECFFSSLLRGCVRRRDIRRNARGAVRLGQVLGQSHTRVLCMSAVDLLSPLERTLDSRGLAGGRFM